jgi:2-polyprenyl-3-methyl-5-hydroxy-6-metoxy-1,4-benzoquinol methylase
MNTPVSAPPRGFAWQTCLDVDNQDADHYLDYWNAPLLGLVTDAPRRVLELGCASGMFGAKLKERFPAAHVTGIEAGHDAAERARERLDHVICARLESVDLALEGLQPGAIDLVIAADILEHLVNPWELLVRLRPFLAPEALVLASIPNVRNLQLVGDLLINGRWSYVERGLLDVTHLRFFTLQEIQRMFAETGYVMQGYDVNLSPSLAPLWEQHRDKAEISLKVGRFTLDNVTPRELAQLCAEQFLVKARVAT